MAREAFGGKQPHNAAHGAATSFNYALTGQVDWTLAGLLLLGGAVGGVVGLFAAKRLAGHSRLARSLFAGMIIVVAGYVAWRSLGG